MSTPVPGMQLVDDFEKAFQDCFAILNNPDTSATVDSDEIRTSADVALQHFQDVSVSMDSFFMQRRLLASAQKPDHFLAESIQELTTELSRKEALLDKYHAKLDVWKRLLKDVADVPMPGVPVETGSVLTDQSSSGLGAGPSTQMSPQASQGAVHPVHLMSDPNMPSMSSSASMQAAMAMQSSPLHPHQFMGGALPVGLQGPLGYMERSMSSFTMPDSSG